MEVSAEGSSLEPSLHEVPRVRYLGDTHLRRTNNPQIRDYKSNSQAQIKPVLYYG